MKNKRVLVISDLHAPFMHKDAVAFLKALKKRYKPDRVILSGDEVDNAAISFHDHDADLPSAGDELKQAIGCLRPIYKLFPKADILESNHGSLVMRKALANGLSRKFFKEQRDILQAPSGWNWHFDLTINTPQGQVYFHHGKSSDAQKVSQAMGLSYCQGHFHEHMEISYWGNPNALMFGMTVGCLVDPKSLALAYNKNNLKRPVIGCAVIIEGRPILVPMTLLKNGRWDGKLV